jgi:tryptophanyl-tRNA synthetase
VALYFLYLHAITVYQPPEMLRTKIRETVGVLLACGIDPAQSLLFIQSHVTAHTTLAWVLNCLAPVGWLERMTQYKDKAAKQESVGLGLLAYPVLMAADILLYQTQFVPVGEDQRQHLELTRDLAGRFNHLYGETFILPEMLIPPVGARIMGLDDPTVKMSKSTNRLYHAVGILDPPDTIMAVMRWAVTDSGREIAFSDDPAKAGVTNLLTIYQALSGHSRQTIEAHFAGKGYGDLKHEVAEVVIDTLRPIQTYRKNKATFHAVPPARGASAPLPSTRRCLPAARQRLPRATAFPPPASPPTCPRLPRG